jgi:drug/metabolite transporter (DMT)-like permease
MATILDEWRPGDLLIEALRVCGGVLLIGGLLVLLLGVLGGSPEPLDEQFDELGLIDQGVIYALVGAALYAGGWALRRLLGRR